MANANAKLTHVLFLLIIAASIAATRCSSSGKQKILGLVKKLERLADTMQANTGSGTGDKAETLFGNEAMATTPPTKKAKVPKERDPTKKYCDAMECPAPVCTEKDIIYYGKLREKSPFPTIYNKCNSRMIIAAFLRAYSDVLTSCCIYNMTDIVVNNDKLLGCMQEVHDTHKKTNPPEGVKYWIAAKWSKACNNYVWCPEKEIIGPDVKWKKGFPKASSGNCVGIHLGNPNPEENGLFNGKCSDLTKYYCIESDVEPLTM